MRNFDVSGMSCAACSSRVEKAVSSVDGVTSCSVNLLTNSMTVEGPATDKAIIDAVTKAGYSASVQKDISDKKINEITDRETVKLRNRLILSAVFLLVLMYLSMGHTMLGLPVPSFMADHKIIGICQMVLAAIVMVINRKFFISGTRSLIHLSPNMDTLVSIGSAASFIYSVWVLFMTEGSMHSLYFESAAMIVTLITVGKMLESYSKGKTTNAIKGLMDLAPKTATVIRDGKESVIPVAEVVIDDIFVVRPGENIPVDGVVIEGTTSVNESALTGESIPADKAEGDKVFAATTNASGFIKCRAEKVGRDTTFSQIIRMVSDASSTKAPIAKTADRVSGVFVPVVMGIALVTFAVWMIIGAGVETSLTRAVSVLVISCPCALGLATPVAIMVGSGIGARNGLLFKTAASLEMLGRTEIAVLDKTGTITEGRPVVTDIIPSGDNTEQELLSYASSLEIKSEHPIAGAIISCSGSRDVASYDSDDFEALSGSGVRAKINGHTITGGNIEFIGSRFDVPADVSDRVRDLSGEGKTPVIFASDDEILGIIAVADVIKQDSREAISELVKMGIDVHMLTGDNDITAHAIAERAGITNVIADVLPGDKESVVRKLQRSGKVLMVGDGINDAPALTRADTGMAIGAGADVAIDSADIVLVKGNMREIPAAIRLSRKVITNIHQNLFWAFFYNVIGIPLAAGVFVGINGWQISPMFGAAAMSLSSFFVVTNALRLNFADIYDPKYDRIIRKKNKKEQEDNMDELTVTMKIEGMMCPHCEARVKKALEGLDQVVSADVSHEKGTAVLILTASADSSLLRKTVEDEGYKVTEIG
ncbi:MAG: heavy metal translocating P-type ATPase [Clostridiales bacterium]|nr:heavy metal translocating P-type ATPase [Clostridiales bacterium]